MFVKRTLLFLLTAMLVFAQTDRGLINGTVTDSSGAAVPEANVVATNRATNITLTTQTTSSGDFTIAAMPVGTYNLRIEKQGFKAAVRSDVIISAGGSITVNAQLEVGAVSESVQVAATLDLLQTSTAKVSTAVSNRMVDELPLVVGGAMRGIFDLALITPESNAGSRDDDFNLGGGQGGG